LGAVIGIGFFGFLAWRAVSILETDSTGAEHNFEEAIASVPSPLPLVRRDASGQFVRDRSRRTTGAAAELHVLAYYADGRRLVRASVPLWWFRVKGPAVRYALRGTGFDLDALGLTAADLEEAGPAVVLDERRTGGDRVLAWTT
jgi:hypothetical protein